MHQGHDQPDPGDHRHAFESPEQVEYAEIEGEALVQLTAQAADALVVQARDHGVRVHRVLDLGSGPGVGTGCLTERFPDAQIVAVDGSAAMLDRVTARAERFGLASQVQTRQADLHTGIGELGPADVVWSSMALHHVGDEAAALRQIHGLLEPGGLLAVVEHAGPVHVLPERVERARPGLGDRLDAAWAAWFEEMRASLPAATASAGYPGMLRDAGFEVLVDRVVEVDLDAPLDATARRFAHRHLAGTRNRLGSILDAADLSALETLIDEHGPEGILRRKDATLHTSRQLYVARAGSRAG